MIHTRPEWADRLPEVIHTHQTAPTHFVEANGIRTMKIARWMSDRKRECRRLDSCTRRIIGRFYSLQPGRQGMRSGHRADLRRYLARRFRIPTQVKAAERRKSPYG
jgi:hypothetical protein